VGLKYAKNVEPAASFEAMTEKKVVMRKSAPLQLPCPPPNVKSWLRAWYMIGHMQTALNRKPLALF